MKTIEIKVNREDIGNYQDCPFVKWDQYVDDYECSLSDQLDSQKNYISDGGCSSEDCPLLRSEIIVKLEEWKTAY